MHKITKLDNGLKIITNPMSPAGSVTVAIFVGAGGRYEDLKTEYGAAHFLEHLLFKGTPTRPSAKKIAETIDSVGGYMNAYTAEDHTSFYIKVPKQHFKLAFDILADIISDPLLKESEIERERGVILEEMNVYKDDPARYVFDLVGKLLWPHDKLQTNVIGTEQTISTMPRKVIYDYYKALYNPDNMVIAVAGNIDHQNVVNYATKSLGRLVKKTKRSYEPTSGRIAKEKLKVIDQDTNQTHLVLTARSAVLDSDEEPIMAVASTVLGMGMSSRLFLNVRERKGLAYTIYSSTSSYIDSGKFEIYAGVNKAKVSLALRAICHELHKIRTELVPEKELDKAKEQLKGRLIMSLENNSAVADRLGSQLILMDKAWSLEETLAKIDNVTAQTIKKATAKYLLPTKLRLAMIGLFSDTEKNKFEEILTSS